MKKLLVWSLAVMLGACLPGTALATPADAEKKVYEELTALIPKDRVVTVDDLYKKWQEVQEKKSNAVIVDIRTHDEFDNGHLLGSNNIDSGHAYSIPALIPDPETEMWIFCRTQHRATYFVSFLYRYGYKNVYLVKGGIAEWAEKGYPLYSEFLGEIKGVKYSKRLKEEYKERQGH